jgi:hypothetical protein
VKPNKAELDALAAVLLTPLSDFLTEKEAAEHKDPEKLAQTRMFTKAIEAVDEARGARALKVVVLRHGSDANCFFTSIGPFATQNQAEKARDSALAATGASGHAITHHRTPEGWAQHVATLDAEPEAKRVGKVEEKHLNARFNSAQRGERLHVRPERKNPEIIFHGTAQELHAQAERGVG